MDRSSILRASTNLVLFLACDSLLVAFAGKRSIEQSTGLFNPAHPPSL